MNELYEGEASRGVGWEQELTEQEIVAFSKGGGLNLAGLVAFWFRVPNRTFVLNRGADGWWHGGLTDLEGDGIIGTA